MNKRIAVITDIDTSGSGYFYLATPILTGLANMGYDIKVAGMSYKGEEHGFPFSVIPCRELQDAAAVVGNLNFVWPFDIILVAMDIPLQLQFFQQFQPLGKKYIAITPLENGPLPMSVAAGIFNMDAIFFISELGKQEAIKAGVTKAEHLYIGVDQTLWYPATSEEKKIVRKGLGIEDDEFVILTVADNQERKNLWAGMDAVSMLKKETDKKIRYILVTREHSPYGHNLRDLANDKQALHDNLNKELNIFNRGIPQKDLRGLYIVSDVYLQPSKAEGLGLPVLQAMACGIPCVATDTGALHELLSDDRGWLVDSEYTFTDVWLNSTRDMMNRNQAKVALADAGTGFSKFSQSALEYIKNRTLDVPVQQIHNKILELFGDKK